MATQNEETIFNNLPAPKPSKDEVNPFQSQLLGDLKKGTIFIHNESGARYHIAPTTKTNEKDDAVAFEVNETRTFTRDEVDNQRFKNALLSGKLRIVTEEQANQIELSAKKKMAKESGKAKAGVSASGLSNNTKQALIYIYECEDIDELEAYADLDEREVIENAVEERIEQLEEQGFGR